MTRDQIAAVFEEWEYQRRADPDRFLCQESEPAQCARWAADNFLRILGELVVSGVIMVSGANT